MRGEGGAGEGVDCDDEGCWDGDGWREWGGHFFFGRVGLVGVKWRDKLEAGGKEGGRGRVSGVGSGERGMPGYQD